MIKQDLFETDFRTLNQAKYFKDYRERLGFTSQKEAKDFLGAKNIKPAINYDYIEDLIDRIKEIIIKVNDTIITKARRENIDDFCKKYIQETYETIKESGIIPKLNNQGRRTENVLFSWMRGYSIVEYFTPSISKLFKIDIETITQIGEDDLEDIQTFRRTPTADLEFNYKGKTIRIEVQSGFQGVNDIKEHKVREAKRVFEEKKIVTICIHYDIYNGQVAYIRLDDISDTDINWVTRQQMEGQSVFTIDQNFFKWRLLDEQPNMEELDIEI